MLHNRTYQVYGLLVSLIYVSSFAISEDTTTNKNILVCDSERFAVPWCNILPSKIRQLHSAVHIY